MAIAIGTSHGAYKFKGEPRLDFERLEKISNLLPGFPIVLHGASTVLPGLSSSVINMEGIFPEQKAYLKKCLKAATMGVCKINIDTDLRLAMTASVRKYLVENPSVFDPRKYPGSAREAIKQMVIHKIKNVLGWAVKKPKNDEVLVNYEHPIFICFISNLPLFASLSLFVFHSNNNISSLNKY